MVLDALQVLHSYGIFHMALKPENVLIDLGVDGRQPIKILLSDYGMYVENSGKVLVEVSDYLAPEINGRYSDTELHAVTLAAESWAFGVLFFFMLNNSLPFSRNLDVDLLCDVENSKLKRLTDPFLYESVATVAQDSNVLKHLTLFFKKIFVCDY